MMIMIMIMILFVFVFVFVFATVALTIEKLWWGPFRVQRMLHSQGIRGPSYKFIHGNTKEIPKMRKEAISSPHSLWNHDLFPRILPHLNTWINLYGSNVLIWMGHQPQIVVTEPELVKEILMNKDGAYQKLKAQGHYKRIVGDGLVRAEGEKWTRLRKLANHAFHGESLKDMFPEMVASVDTMLERWGDRDGRQEIEISNEINLLTSEVISRTAFGSSYNEGKNIFEMFTKMCVLAARNDFRVRFFGLEKIWRSKDDIESEKMEQQLRDSILTLVKKREDEGKAGESDNYGSDFLGSLLRAHHDSDPKNRISEDNIIDECKVFYIAGHATISSLLSWTIVLLSNHTEWQDRARQEVLQLFGREKPTPDGIIRLRILSMIINEALRLYGPIVSLNRIAHSRTKLGKYELPANVEVNVPPLALHRNPAIWGEDAHLFKPERFDQGLAKAANGNSMAFIPFGAGPRACVGLNFATNEAKITLSMILQRYRLSLSPGYVHAPFQIMAVSPQHGIQIIAHSL